MTPSLNDTFVTLCLPWDMKCKISFCVYSYKSAAYRVISNFFGHILVFGSEMLYLCTSNRKKASLVPKVGLYRRHIWISIDVRRQTSITTQIRARNGASGELKYQPSKHTQSMINYSITMRSVNSNLMWNTQNI